MADNVKVIIAERNGVELDYNEEYELIAENIPFDNSTNGFTAADVQEAIEEAAESSTPVEEERLISVKIDCTSPCKPKIEAALLIDQSLCFLKSEEC